MCAAVLSTQFSQHPRSLVNVDVLLQIGQIAHRESQVDALLNSIIKQVMRISDVRRLH